MSREAIIQTPVTDFKFVDYAHQIMETVSNTGNFCLPYHFRHLYSFQYQEVNMKM